MPGGYPVPHRRPLTVKAAAFLSVPVLLCVPPVLSGLAAVQSAHVMRPAAVCSLKAVLPPVKAVPRSVKAVLPVL